jgi:hypothetical protein
MLADESVADALERSTQSFIEKTLGGIYLTLELIMGRYKSMKVSCGGAA